MWFFNFYNSTLFRFFCVSKNLFALGCTSEQISTSFLLQVSLNDRKNFVEIIKEDTSKSPLSWQRTIEGKKWEDKLNRPEKSPQLIKGPGIHQFSQDANELLFNNFVLEKNSPQKWRDFNLLTESPYYLTILLFVLHLWKLIIITMI